MENNGVEVKKREKRSNSTVVSRDSTKENAATKSKSGSGIFSRSSRSPLVAENGKSGEVPKLGSGAAEKGGLSSTSLTNLLGFLSPRGSRSNSIVGDASPFSPHGKKEVTLEEEFSELSQALADVELNDSQSVVGSKLAFMDCVGKFPAEKQAEKLNEHEGHKLQVKVTALWSQVKTKKDPSYPQDEMTNEQLRSLYENLMDCYTTLFENFSGQQTKEHLEGWSKVTNELLACNAKNVEDKKVCLDLSASIATPVRKSASSGISVVFMDEIKRAFGFLSFDQKQFMQNLLAVFKHFFEVQDNLSDKPLNAQDRQVAFEEGVRALFSKMTDDVLEQWKKCLSSNAFGQLYGVFSWSLDNEHVYSILEIPDVSKRDTSKLAALATLTQLMQTFFDMLNNILKVRKLSSMALDFLDNARKEVVTVDEKTRKAVHQFIVDYLREIVPEAGIPPKLDMRSPRVDANNNLRSPRTPRML